MAMTRRSLLVLTVILESASAGVISNLVYTNYCESKPVPEFVAGTSNKACATIYREKRCKEGWILKSWTLPVGSTDFGLDVLGIGVCLVCPENSWRNTIESIQVAAGCTLVGYDDNNFGGDSVTIAAGSSQRDVLDLDDLDNDDLDNDIESIVCTCN